MKPPSFFIQVLARLSMALGVLLTVSNAQAMLVQAPAGAKPLTLPNGRVLCGTPPDGWEVSASRTQIHPRPDTPIGNRATAVVADSLAECKSDRVDQLKLLVTGSLAHIDPASVVAWVDAGRLEFTGKSLLGTKVEVRAKGLSAKKSCIDVQSEETRETCWLNVDKALPADPLSIELRWAPPAGSTSADAYTFDESGALIPADNMRLSVGKVLISRLFPTSRVVDIASGEGRIELEHPEALSMVRCTDARCESTDWGVLVSAVRAETTVLEVNANLIPRVFLASGDKFVSNIKENVKVLRCPISVVSGRPMRNASELKVLIRMDKACGQDAEALRWTSGGHPLDIVRVESLHEGVFVLLALGRVSADRLTLLASRKADGSVIALTTIRTREAPLIQTALTLPTIGLIDFIPKNRQASLSVSAVEGTGRLVPISVPGVYTVRETKIGFLIRGAAASAGYTALRFALRVDVPEPFANIDFARLTDPVQRPIREANIPAPIGAAGLSKQPIVELRCVGKQGKRRSIPTGSAQHIPFDQRESCYLLIHRERLPKESGEQHLTVDVSVSAIGGADRAEARSTHRLLLRHGKKPEVIWIRGAKEQFDRISIRVTHAVDQADYLSSARFGVDLPSAQWSVVTEDADFKFYATATIPASLYRFSSDPGELGTGPLALNFGLLSRLTWLDSDGQEGLVGLEAGVMGMGLAVEKDRQLAFVAGLGIAIPLGNPNQTLQAAINLHAWAAYTIGERTAPLMDEQGEFIRNVKLNPWAFVFGPSITVGSVGAFL